jgi:TRAP-type C4-dicarboxylate transport system substrate-binding protein
MVATAAPRVVKLATLVPDGSVWDKILKEMGAEWQQATEGRVTLRVYPGGVAGDDPDVVRKMRIGQLHAGALTVTGLTDLDPAFSVFAIPLFFESYEELFYVLEKMQPVLNARLEEKGFILLHWGHAGWVHVFSRHPVRRPEDLRKQKMFVWAGSDETVQRWKDNGFRPVALAATDMMTGLQTGMIDALPTTPLVSLSLQWFRQVPHMADLGLGPLIGATVVTKRAWNAISAEDRAAIEDAARLAEERLEAEIPDQDSTAVEEMQARGLEVTEIESLEEWKAIAARFISLVEGGQVPQEILDLAVAEREAFRRARAAGEDS